MRSIRLSAPGLVLAAALFATGCAGHGKYTEQHISAAKEKMQAMKSATEWEMAKQAFLAGDLEKAKKGVDRSLALNPNVAKSHVLKGRILLEMGDLESAANSLMTAQTIDPTFVEAAYYLGICYERFTQKDKALEAYTKAADLDQAAPQYAIAAAEMMVDLGKVDEAQAYLETRRVTFEHNAGVRQTLGHIALIKGDNERAVTLFSEARLLAPDDQDILEDLARAQVEVSQFADAENNLAKLLGTPEFKNRRDLQMIRARCLVQVERPLEARQILIGLTTDQAGSADTEAWIELGNVAYLLKDMQRVRQASSRVVAIAPQRAEGYLLRALYQRRTGDLAGARANLDKAVTLGAGPEAQDLIAIVEQELGGTATAEVPTSGT